MNDSKNSPVISFFGDIADLLIAGFLWLLCSIPIVTLGASSCALYYTVVKVIRRKRETVGKAFLHSFKENLGQGCIITILYGLYACVILVFVSVTGDAEGGDPAIIAALLVLVLPFVVTLMYICPVISRFQNGILRQLWLSFYLALAHPLTTLLLLLISAAVILLIYFCTFLLGILPGIYVLVCSLLIERVLKKHMKQQAEQFEDTDDIPWYLE